MSYQNCFFIGHENKNIIIITIKDDYPIINIIDILNGEIIIKNMIKFEKITTYMEYCHYVFWFANEYNDYIKFIDDEFHTLHAVNYKYDIVKYNGQSIQEKVLLFSSDNQKQYVGEFTFNSYKIISQENYEINKLAFENRKNIIIFLNQDGYLVAKNIYGGADIEFKICDERKIIQGNYGDGTLNGFTDEWSFINKNIIQYEHEHFINKNIESDNMKRIEIHYTVKYIRK